MTYQQDETDDRASTARTGDLSGDDISANSPRRSGKEVLATDRLQEIDKMIKGFSDISESEDLYTGIRRAQIKLDELIKGTSVDEIAKLNNSREGITDLMHFMEGVRVQSQSLNDIARKNPNLNEIDRDMILQEQNALQDHERHLITAGMNLTPDAEELDALRVHNERLENEVRTLLTENSNLNEFLEGVHQAVFQNGGGETERADNAEERAKKAEEQVKELMEKNKKLKETHQDKRVSLSEQNYNLRKANKIMQKEVDTTKKDLESTRNTLKSTEKAFHEMADKGIGLEDQIHNLKKANKKKAEENKTLFQKFKSCMRNYMNLAGSKFRGFANKVRGRKEAKAQEVNTSPLP